MLVIPAIDLKDGKCVRLRQGDMDDDTVYSDDPVAMAERWISAGARRIHIVDLDGARDGQPCVYGNFARSQVLPGGDYDLTSWTPAREAFCELEAMGCIVLGAR